MENGEQPRPAVLLTEQGGRLLYIAGGGARSPFLRGLSR